MMLQKRIAPCCAASSAAKAQRPLAVQLVKPGPCAAKATTAAAASTNTSSITAAPVTTSPTQQEQQDPQTPGLQPTQQQHQQQQQQQPPVAGGPPRLRPLLQRTGPPRRRPVMLPRAPPAGRLAAGGNGTAHSSSSSSSSNVTDGAGGSATRLDTSGGSSDALAMQADQTTTGTGTNAGAGTHASLHTANTPAATSEGAAQVMQPAAETALIGEQQAGVTLAQPVAQPPVTTAAAAAAPTTAGGPPRPPLRRPGFPPFPGRCWPVRTPRVPTPPPAPAAPAPAPAADTGQQATDLLQQGPLDLQQEAGLLQPEAAHPQQQQPGLLQGAAVVQQQQQQQEEIEQQSQSLVAAASSHVLSVQSPAVQPPSTGSPPGAADSHSWGTSTADTAAAVASLSITEKLQRARAAMDGAMAADSSRIWEGNGGLTGSSRLQELPGSGPAVEGSFGSSVEGLAPEGFNIASSSSGSGSGSEVLGQGAAAASAADNGTIAPQSSSAVGALHDTHVKVEQQHTPVSVSTNTSSSSIGGGGGDDGSGADTHCAVLTVSAVSTVSTVSTSGSSTGASSLSTGEFAKDKQDNSSSARAETHSRSRRSSRSSTVSTDKSSSSTAGRRRRRSSAVPRATTPAAAAADSSQAAATAADSLSATAPCEMLLHVAPPTVQSSAAAPPQAESVPHDAGGQQQPAAVSLQVTPAIGVEADMLVGQAPAPAPAQPQEQSLAAAQPAAIETSSSEQASRQSVGALPAALAAEQAAVTPEPAAAPAATAAADSAEAEPVAPPAAAAKPSVRRTKAAEGSAGATGLSAAAVGQLLARQRDLGAANRRANRPTGNTRAAGSSNSSRATGNGSSSLQSPGEIVQLHGRWKLTGFAADQKALDSLIPALQARLSSGVQAEQAQEQAAIKKLYSASSLRQLQRDGVVLLQLQATPSHVLYSSMVWRFSLGGPSGQQGKGSSRGRDLPYHRFRQGDSLLISRVSEDQLVEVSAANSRSTGMSRINADNNNDLRPGSQDFRALDATVVEVRKDHLLLALEKFDSDRMQQELRLAPAAALVSWRLDQSVRDTTARRQLDAIKRLSQPTTDSPFEALLRMVLVGTTNGAYGASVPPEWVRDAGWRQDVKQLLAQTQGLNNSQRRAIALAVLRCFTLWQGPPGTGKTRTLLALVEVLVKTAQRQPRRWSAMGPILACGDTNAAVDNLVEGLLDKGLRVVRLGQPAKVRANLQQYTLEAQAERTPDGQRAVQLRQDSKVLFEQSKQAADGSLLSWANKGRSAPALVRSGRSSGSSKAAPPPPAVGSSEALDKAARSKWAEAERLAKRAAQQVLQEAEVVCATCSGAGDPLLNELHFNMVVIDEATQATEPATLVPLTQGARCVVMAGDPAQLPPTVTSHEAAQEHGLHVTLFERLQTTLGMEPLLLDTQYRMNPAISAFPSRRFYGGKLQDGVTSEQKPAAVGLTWPRPDEPVMVLAVQGLEEQAKKSAAKAADGSDILLYGQDAAAASGGLMEASYRNLQEARVALQAVYALMTAGDAQTAAILTPYKGQVRAFEHALRVLSPWFDPELMSRITVSSVDGYQGREADVVLFSAVRCNKQGRIGFVSDRRRLNVAITRPRRGLVVVCCPETLQKGSDDWRAFLTWCQERQWVAGMQALPSAPWQLQGVDPFGPAEAAGSSTSSWSSASSEEL